MTDRTKEKGFSLIELLIVVVIIGIVAAIAIPNLLSARRASNEASAISSLRTIGSANVAFMGTSGRFANDMWELGAVGLIDKTLSTDTGGGVIRKAGYSYWNYRVPATSTTPEEYELWVFPSQLTGVTATGVNSYYTNETGVIYVLTGTSPTGVTTTNRVPSNGTPLNR